MKCCLCGGQTFEKVFDLGTLPLGFPVEPSIALSNQVWKQKLELVMCKQCTLVQTAHKIPNEELVSENLYLSGSSKLVSDHDEQFSSNIPSLLSLSKDSLILEIGCGDGSLLENFCQKGFNNVIGIEPSIHKKEYPFEVIVDFLNADVVKSLRNSGKYPDCIISNYVLELVPDLANLMKKGSFLVIEVPYFNDFLKNFRIDGFAHLRHNWFTVNSLIYALDKHNMEIVSIEHDINYRGGTLRVIAKKEHSKGNLKPDLLDWKNKEIEELNSRSFNSFRDKINGLRDDIKTKIAELTEKKIPIYGYGGGLKASTLVNWLNLTSKEIKMVVDIDPNKHHKMIPIANIPVKPVSDLFNQEENTKIAVIILALDHVNEVEKFLLRKLRKGSRIINLLQEFKVITV